MTISSIALSNILLEGNSTTTFTCTKIEISFQSLKSNTKDTLMSREKTFCAYLKICLHNKGNFKKVTKIFYEMSKF